MIRKSVVKTRLWDVICVAVLVVVLTLGLWPFHSPKNDVTWLENRNGLRFGRFSTVISSAVFQVTSDENEACGSVEVWLQPSRIWDDGTFLAFYTPGNPHQFLLRQFNGGLELRAETRDDSYPAKMARLYVQDTFRKSEGVFLTITSRTQGTAVYIDGVLAKMAPQFRLSRKELTGRLLLGDSPGQSDSWSGQVRGVAVYHRELRATQVLRHYETWTQRERPEIFEDEGNIALYLFGERTGNVVHDHAASGVNLFIPEKYLVWDQIFLEPFWKELSMSWSYWGAAVKNIIGFVPFGLCFCAGLLAHKVRRAALATVILGTLVSLTIEVLQAYLPTRDSGMTDVFTNTLGTCLGVIFWRGIQRVLTGGRWRPASLSNSAVL